MASPDEVQDFARNWIHQQPVDGEVATLDIFARILAEAYGIRMAAVGVTHVGAECCDLDNVRFRGWQRLRIVTFSPRKRCRVIEGRIIRNGYQHDSELRAYRIGLRKDSHDLGGCGF